MLALLLALGAALLNASGDLLQRDATRGEPQRRSGSWRLLWDLVRSPPWLGGVLVSLLGLAVHVLALSWGQIATVQPVLVLELPLAVLGSSRLFRTRLSRRDWAAVAVLTIGLAMFVFALAPSEGTPLATPGMVWAVGLGVLLAVVTVLIVVGSRSGQDLRAGLLGAAAGAGYGTAAVLFSAAGAIASAAGLSGVLTIWQGYAALVVGALSFYVLQNSLNSGLLVATEPGLTLVNPLVAVLWGLFVFGEQARTGPWLVGSVGGAVLLVLGTLLLSNSPVLHASGSSGAESASPQRAGSEPERSEPARG